MERVLRVRGCNFRIFREGLPALSRDLEERRGEPCGNLGEAFPAEGTASGRTSDICSVSSRNNPEDRVAENSEQKQGSRR